MPVLQQDMIQRLNFDWPRMWVTPHSEGVISVKRILKRPVLSCFLLAVCLLQVSAAAEAEKEFVPIFNGQDLTQWTGEPGWWSVEDGAITAESTTAKPCVRHTYLIWDGGEPGDFDLRLEFRLVGGNSGVQFRSRRVPPWDVNGYQADMDASGEWTGALFEHARGGIALRGQRVTIDEDGTRQVAVLGDPAELLKKIKSEDWNFYRITAQGDHIALRINGELLAEAFDRMRNQAARRGVIALQMHPGPPMKVQFRKLRIRIDDKQAEAAQKHFE